MSADQSGRTLTSNEGDDMNGERHSEPLVLIEEWADEPDEGRSADDWPYPTTYKRSRAQGELAERIRRALAVAENLPVYVVERVESSGYSEYTQEDDYFLTVTVGDAEKEFEGEWSGGLTALLRWLDKAAPVEAKP